MPLEVPDRDEWFPKMDDIPSPDWPAINTYLRENVTPAQRAEATGRITTYWLTRLASALGSQYAISSGEYYVILSNLAEEQCHRMHGFLDEACGANVLPSLGEAPPLALARKWVLIRLADMDTNFRVMPTLDCGGEATAEAGEFFGSGSYPFLYCGEEVNDGEFTSLVWPFTYHVLGHLPLPVWLHVAYAIFLTARFNREPAPAIGNAAKAEHRTRWNERSIQEFWSGRFFYDPIWQDISNSLALAIFEIIERESSRDPEALQRFICEATAKDAGEAAALDAFRKSLADFVTAFLGDGDWSPHPPAWETSDPVA